MQSVYVSSFKKELDLNKEEFHISNVQLRHTLLHDDVWVTMCAFRDGVWWENITLHNVPLEHAA